MKKITCIALLVLFMDLPMHAQEVSTEVQTEVMMKMMSLKNGLLNKDSASLSKLLADDLTYGHSTGLMQSKAELIHSLMTGEQQYKLIEPSDINIRVLGNTAIVTMRSKVNLLMRGKPLELSMNVLLVWIKEQNAWKLHARQSVKNN